MSEPADLTRMLNQWAAGDARAGDDLLRQVYQQLRQMSAQRLRAHGGPVTLQATELINEAFLRLARQNESVWANRSHFYAIAATVMRRVLLDHARHRHSQRRDRRMETPLEAEHAIMSEQRAQELIELDEAIEQLAQLSERQARIIELRYFGGLSIEEAAETLEISPATVKREWNAARAWLARKLGSPDEDAD
jgi:RNA polymerase sigma-70 factor, ECF subfamily